MQFSIRNDPISTQQYWLTSVTLVWHDKHKTLQLYVPKNNISCELMETAKRIFFSVAASHLLLFGHLHAQVPIGRIWHLIEY